MNLRGATLALLIGISSGLAACGGGGDDEEAPAELVPITNELGIRKLWSTSVGGESLHLRLGLRPAADGQRIYAAAANGRVSAFEPASGKRLWSVDTDLPLSAGPGAGGSTVALGSSEGVIIALNAADGTERWRSEVSSEVLAAPLVVGNFVIVRTVDGRLQALAGNDGSELWAVSRRIQGLTLRGNSRPAQAGAAVIAGFDNGKVVAVRTETGQVLWEETASIARGRTDLERLADVDSNVLVTGNEVYVAGYRGRVLALSAASGSPVWSNEVSTFNPLAADAGRVYVATADDRVVALGRVSGSQSWQNDSFKRRRLTGPAVLGGAVVVGDLEGYLHWLGATDGKYLARSRAGSNAIIQSPLVINSRLYVQTEGGELAAFALTEPES